MINYILNVDHRFHIFRVPNRAIVSNFELGFLLFFFIENGYKGKLGKPAYLEKWITTLTSITAGDSVFTVTFEWDEEVGVPGAFIIKNNHGNEFFLKTLTLEDVPGEGRVHFVCNSWVYPADKYNYDRIFFRNKVK